MKRSLIAAAALVMPATALAHTAIVEHAHPHEAAHPYLGLETIVAFGAGLVVAGIVAYSLWGRARGNK